MKLNQLDKNVLGQADCEHGKSMAFLGSTAWEADAPHGSVAKLVKRGLLVRTGRRGCYRYQTTEAGRNALANTKLTS